MPSVTWPGFRGRSRAPAVSGWPPADGDCYLTRQNLHRLTGEVRRSGTLLDPA